MDKRFKINHFFTDKSDKNLAFHVGDDIKNVIQNHKNLAVKYGYNYHKLVYMKQIHSDKVHILKGEDNFSNPPTSDALITNKLDTPIMVMVADCTPVILYDDKKGVVAVVHAGRAGAFNNILKNTINSFKNDFNSNLADIKVVIGVSISKDCYEVSKDIYDEAKVLALEYAVDKKDDRYYLDIKKILHKQLKDEGIKMKQIKDIKGCNCCDTQNYFSYRKEKQTGRYAGVIYISS